MQFKETNHYPFSADAVVKVFGDPECFLAKYRGTGARNIQLLEASNEDGKGVGSGLPFPTHSLDDAPCR